jgi:hypothetical protein
MFVFVQFLLDDDANLTPAGNLTGAARQRLRSRLEELIAAEEAGGPQPALSGTAATADASEPRLDPAPTVTTETVEAP